MERARYVIACLCLLQLAIAAEAPSMEIASASRSVDLTSHLAKISTTLEAKNTGSKPTRTLLYEIQEKYLDSLSYITVTLAKDPERTLKIVKDASVKKGTTYLITLATDLAPKSTVSVVVYEVHRSLQQPFPKETKQSESQLMLATFNAHIFSPYKIESQTTTFKLASSNIISYSKVEPYVQNDNVVEYGPFKVVAPRSVADVSLHFENHSPFLTVTSLVRWIEVSHWGGNIAVEENIQMRHSGAKLQGSFSRFDYMYLRSQEGISSVKSYKTIMPAGAKDVYYRDEIGNISTSNMLELLDSVELEIRPRYPLFGGWVTHYMLGYNLPSFQYLFNSGSDYLLRMRFLDHVFDDMSVDEIIVKIVLPEGATDIKVEVPYEYEREPDTLHYTFLDIGGRPLVTLKKSNLVEDHIQDFTVSYQFSSILLLREPLMLIVGLLILFMTVIGFVRLDFSISVDTSAEAKMKVAGVIEQIIELENKRDSLCAKFEDAIKGFRKSKDSDTLHTARRAIEAENKEIRAAVDVVIKELRAENGEIADKVTAVQKLEADYFQAIVDSAGSAQKVVSGSFSHEAFKKAEELNDQKKADLKQKVHKQLAQL